MCARFLVVSAQSTKKEAGPSACLRSTHLRHHAFARHCAQWNPSSMASRRLLRPSGLSIKAQLKFCVAISRKLRRPLRSTRRRRKAKDTRSPSPAPSININALAGGSASNPSFASTAKPQSRCFAASSTKPDELESQTELCVGLNVNH